MHIPFLVPRLVLACTAIAVTFGCGGGDSELQSAACRTVQDESTALQAEMEAGDAASKEALKDDGAPFDASDPASLAAFQSRLAASQPGMEQYEGARDAWISIVDGMPQCFTDEERAAVAIKKANVEKYANK